MRSDLCLQRGGVPARVEEARMKKAPSFFKQLVAMFMAIFSLLPPSVGFASLSSSSTAAIPHPVVAAEKLDGREVLVVVIFSPATGTVDANGNTVNSGGNADSYDFENHLTSRNTTQVQVAYDGDGNRVSETVGGVTTLYLVDTKNPTGYAQVLEEIRGGGGVVRAYTYGTQRISQDQIIGAAFIVSFYQTDGHGNVRSLTDLTGAVTDTYDYDAFGVLLHRTGTTPNNYLYAGEQRDPALGLDYLRARYMNPGTGRFWTMDSFEGFAGDPQSLHKYLYANADPVNRVDPSGRIGVVQFLATTAVGRTILALGGPAVVLLQKNISTILRGTARAADLAQRIVAKGGEILAWEERVVAGRRFTADMIAKLPGRTINTLVESKSVPWDMFTKYPAGWDRFLNQLQNQANAFGSTTQSPSGISIGERAIYFTGRIPQGLEAAGAQVKIAIGNNYQLILWGERELEMILEK